jgi:hypothetical protein
MIEIALTGAAMLASFCVGRLARSHRRGDTPGNGYGLGNGFANHPIPMIVYRWESLTIVAANAAASR